jgi:signal transduction histidine kinase
MKGFMGEAGLGQPTRLGAIRYGTAVLAVIAGLLLATALRPFLEPAVVLLMAILIAAWFSGFWPALLASALATLALDYFFIPPLYTIDLDRSHVLRMAVFTMTAGVFVSISAARRRAERSLKQARDELDAKVRERTADLTRANEELEELAGRLISAQEQERSRIGRELHDHISQMLGVLTIRIDQLRANDSIPPHVAGALDDLRQSTAEITEDIHGLSHRLHSSALDYLGLVPALQKLVNEFSTRQDIAIDFVHDALPLLPSEVALCLFRVTEESLTNVAKHSHARSARVQVNGGPDGIHLIVEDTGRGFDPGSLERRAGLGFVSMRERLRAVRGTVHVDTAVGRGTRIDVWVPNASSVQPARGEPPHGAASAR